MSSPLRRISPWAAGLLAVPVLLGAASCSSSSSSPSASSSGSAVPTVTASASVPAPAAAGSGTQASALCADVAALRATTTSFAHLTLSATTANTVTADIRAMTTEVNDIRRDAQGQFSSQVNGLESALTTLRTRMTALTHGNGSVNSVTTAAKNVKAAAGNLTTAAGNACPSAGSSPG